MASRTMVGLELFLDIVKVPLAALGIYLALLSIRQKRLEIQKLKQSLEKTPRIVSPTLDELIKFNGDAKRFEKWKRETEGKAILHDVSLALILLEMCLAPFWRIGKIVRRLKIHPGVRLPRRVFFALVLDRYSLFFFRVMLFLFALEALGKIYRPSDVSILVVILYLSAAMAISFGSTYAIARMVERQRLGSRELQKGIEQL